MTAKIWMISELSGLRPGTNSKKVTSATGAAASNTGKNHFRPARNFRISTPTTTAVCAAHFAHGYDVVDIVTKAFRLHSSRSNMNKPSAHLHRLESRLRLSVRL